MKCQYAKIGKTKGGTRYACQNPRCGHQRVSKLPPEKLHRQCAASPEKQPGFKPERTDAEVLVLITNFCNSCPAWNPAAEKKKCKYCGCGSSDTVENLHKRRIRNCPKGHWTEASLQRYLHSEATPDPLAPAKTEPAKTPCTVCGKPSTTICGYATFLMCGAPLCDTCTHPHRL